MTELDFESAQLQLVTDALRAGPGTPEWRTAISTLDQNGSAGAESSSTIRNPNWLMVPSLAPLALRRTIVTGSSGSGIVSSLITIEMLCVIVPGANVSRPGGSV